MTIVGCGLFALAASIVFAAWLFHRDVVKVYYPKEHKCCSQEGMAMVRQAAQEGKLSEAEQWMDMEDELEDQLWEDLKK
jgi:hypothetical protein